MSNSTPPGWYPVPGADGTPGHERWWDGNAWTSDVRPLQGGAGQLADAPTQWQPSPQQPGYGYPGQGPDYGYSAQGAAQQPGYGYPGQEAYPGAGYGYPGAGYPQPAPDRTKPGVIIGIAVAVLAVGGIIAGIA
ncbi:DUF2510 domain-containing protein, partial [Streptomyces sp. FH025]|uniref:DUF2510 domain-containing protein n=1 Tax=Streptomyces sp. FH025 TaxID=2815937 RepID=UPI0027DD2A89